MIIGAIILVGVALGFMLAPFFLGGLLWFVVGMRLKKNLVKHGADPSSFWLNFIAFTWTWAEQADEIIRVSPHFRDDLTETFGYRPRDNKT